MAGNVAFSKLRNHLIGTGVAMAGWVAFSYVPNTIGVKYAKGVIESYSPYYKSISAEPQTQALLNEVIRDINANQVKPVKTDGIEFVQTNILLPGSFHKGNSSTGAFIGLSIGTRCNAEDVFHYHCPTEVSIEMSKFCLLSREAKKFLFARQIYYVEDNYILFRCATGLGLVAAGSFLHYLWNSALDSLKEMQFKIKKMDSKGKPKFIEEFRHILKGRALRHRVFTFLAIGIVCSQIYGFSCAQYNWMLEKSADEKVAKLGTEYRIGGLQFYENLIAGNKFNYMRLGKECGSDASGNKIQGKFELLHKHIPLTIRCQYFATAVTRDKTDLTESTTEVNDAS